MRTALFSAASMAVLLPVKLAHAVCTPIATPADFDKIRANLAGGFCQTADIDLSGIANFVPIGRTRIPFTGSFNGRGYTISNLTIDDSKLRILGLFSALGKPATLRDIHLVNADIRSRAPIPRLRVGALVGTMRGGTAVLSSSSRNGTVQAQGSHYG